MTRPLAESVYVAGRFFAAGAVPDEEFAALITNPRAWGDPVDTPADRRRARKAVPAVQEPTTTTDEDDTESAPGSAPGEVFDPSADGVTIDDVNNHLANADDDEVRRVLAAEAAGKNRKGIVEGPYAPDED